jgi:hypothetical protein
VAFMQAPQSVSRLTLTLLAVPQRALALQTAAA